MSRNRTRAALVALAAAVLAVFGVGIAWASIPDGSGVIHACYQSPPPAHGANLQVIDTGAGGSCSGGMAALTWNQAGPQGPAGTNGVSGYVEETCHLNGSGSTSLCTDTTNLPQGQLSGTLSCPSGKTAIAASWSQPSPSGTGVFGSAVPASGGTNYQFTFETFGSAATAIDVYVTCVIAS